MMRSDGLLASAAAWLLALAASVLLAGATTAGPRGAMLMALCNGGSAPGPDSDGGGCDPACHAGCPRRKKA